MSTTQDVIESFSRTAEEFISLDEFRRLLDSGRQLRIKYGVDVTAPFLHTGHAVNLWMMRELQDMGHKIQFLIGDYTTRIGDPTGDGSGPLSHRMRSRQTRRNLSSRRSWCCASTTPGCTRFAGTPNGTSNVGLRATEIALDGDAFPADFARYVPGAHQGGAGDTHARVDLSRFAGIRLVRPAF